MTKINLIPRELSVGGSVHKTAKKITNISIGTAVFAGFGVIAFLGVTLFYNQNINKLNSSNNILKNQISALQQSEQKLVFAKDRLGKITEVQAQDSAAKGLENFNFLYDFINTSGMFVLEVSVASDKLEMSMSSTSLSATTSLFEFLEANKSLFDIVEVPTFSYSPTSGYIINLEFKNK